MSRGLAPCTNPFGPPTPSMGDGNHASINNTVNPFNASTTNPFDNFLADSDDDSGHSSSDNRAPDVTKSRTKTKTMTDNYSSVAHILKTFGSDKGGGTGYDYNKGNGDPIYMRWFRSSLYIAQIVIICGGILCSVGAYIAENNGWTFAPGDVRFGLMENQLIFIPYVCGGFSLITATIGFIGAKLHKKIGNFMILMYLGSILITLGLSIGGAAQGFADRGNVYFYAERQWKSMTITEEKTFEFDMRCCNFDSVEPCCRFGYGVTDCVNEHMCFERVQGHLEENFMIIAVTSLVHAILLTGITCAAFVIYVFMRRKEEKLREKEEDIEKESLFEKLCC